MKKLILSIVVLLTVVAQSFAADSARENEKAARTLKKEFADATHVTWAKVANSDLLQAHFLINKERYCAYFDEDGQLVATGGFLNFYNLPMLINRLLREKYQSYVVVEAFEMVNRGETTYVLTIENQTRRIVLQTYDNGLTTVVKKTKKQ